MIGLQDLNILLGMIAVMLLVFSDILSIRSRKMTIRLNKNRLRNASFVLMIAFTLTLLIYMIWIFIYNS